MDLKKYTNISLEPLGKLDGIDIKPCMKSGFCCIKVPCFFGEWNEDESACKHLLPQNNIGQRDCGRYGWIKENVPNYDVYPAFGAGCSSPLFNELRNKIIENIKTVL